MDNINCIKIKFLKMYCVYLFVVLIFLTIPTTPIFGANILGMFTTQSRSHLIMKTAVMKALAGKGHNVTVISSFPPENPIDNYRQIYVKPNYENDNEYNIMVDILLENAEKSRFGFLTQISNRYKAISNYLLQHSNHSLHHSSIRKLMDDEKFDLFVLGWIFNEHQLGLAAHFKCPSVIISPTTSLQLLRDLVGTPSVASYVPHIFFSYKNDGDVMIFLRRVKNLLIVFCEYLFSIILNYVQEYYYSSNFPSDRYPSFDEVKKNVSLVLINYHLSQGIVRPYQPAMVEIGGIQIKQTPSPLPEELKIFMDSAVDGVIFFSLGSNVKSSELPNAKLKSILNIFSRLKQRIIWKWEDENLPGKPDNVFIEKWLPQDDILSHPNTLLFISHCGLGSVVESKYHGVPILAIPLFGDQPSNANAIVNEGWAIQLPYSQLEDGEKFYSILMEILTNPHYKERAKRLSELYRDRPLPALDTGVYWIEYILRHNGAKHMQSQSIQLNFFQLYSLDVISFLIAIFYALIKIFICILNRIFCGLKITNNHKKND